MCVCLHMFSFWSDWIDLILKSKHDCIKEKYVNNETHFVVFLTKIILIFYISIRTVNALINRNNGFFYDSQPQKNTAFAMNYSYVPFLSRVFCSLPCYSLYSPGITIFISSKLSLLLICVHHVVRYFFNVIYVRLSSGLHSTALFWTG